LLFFGECSIIVLQYNLGGENVNCEKWLKLNTQNLAGKTVAISGSTGGLGVELCRYIAKLSGNLILLNRNVDKTQQQI
jgi:FlaA1/EpsC-like NDP-sugar epimerase